MSACERFPEEDTDCPDIAGGGRFVARETLGCDVGERAGDVTDRCKRVSAVELGEAEVEQPN